LRRVWGMPAPKAGQEARAGRGALR
jgi:hypothetical protein